MGPAAACTEDRYSMAMSGKKCNLLVGGVRVVPDSHLLLSPQNGGPNQNLTVKNGVKTTGTEGVRSCGCNFRSQLLFLKLAVTKMKNFSTNPQLTQEYMVSSGFVGGCAWLMCAHSFYGTVALVGTKAAQLAANLRRTDVSNIGAEAA
eukprot:g8911.t1